MLFQVYGDTAIYQWIGWILVFCCLIGANELARRTKTGGVIAFLIVPAILTIYFITIYVAAAMGAEWALSNPTYVHMTSWFHYAKLYAATAGCIGFMALKYKWGQDRQVRMVQTLPVRARGQHARTTASASRSRCRFYR